MTPTFVMSVAAAAFLGSVSMSTAPQADTATAQTLSSSQIGSLLDARAGANLPPNCEAFYSQGICLGVVCQEDDPATPWFDPRPVFYDCSEFGL